jgi:hypothetical protein
MFRQHTLKSMLDRHGVEVTLRVNSTAGTYDPATGTITGSATTDYTVMVYPSDFTLEEKAKYEVVEGDRKILIPTRDTCDEAIPTPSVDDKIVGLEDTVSIVSVQTIYSGSAVCFICHVRE